MFSCEFCETFKDFFYRTPPDDCFCIVDVRLGLKDAAACSKSINKYIKKRPWCLHCSYYILNLNKCLPTEKLFPLSEAATGTVL